MATPPAPRNDSLLVQVHTNEYQALYTRATYFITLSSGVWPLIILYLTLVALIWSLLPPTAWRAPVLVWVSGIIVQGILLIWVSLLSEMYRIVLYIEKYLRPLVQDSVGTSGFWLYEPLQMLKRRGSRFSTWWEFSVPIGMFTALLTVGLGRLFSGSLVVWDYVGASANLGVWALLSLNSLAAVKIRHTWEAAEPAGIESFCK